MAGERETATTAIERWKTAFDRALDDALEHLAVVIFEERWEETRAAVASHEETLRECVARYERELARLFAFVRASGALPDGVGWSTLKATRRKAALEADIEITLRTALETGFYVAEPVPLGDHASYVAWVAALTAFLASRADNADPPASSTEDDRLAWAYGLLADLADHDAFHAALAAHTSDPTALTHGARLLALPRFDLVLNASLWWLALSGDRRLGGDFLP